MLLDIEGICRLVQDMSPTFCDGPGKGIHLFVSTVSEDDLRSCALAIAQTVGPSNPLEVYVVQGRARGEAGWPFSRLRAGSRVRLCGDGSLVSEDSLILPQTMPIVLLVESFGYLDHFDQRAYCHLVDGEGGELSLFCGSVLVCGVTGGDEEDIEAGSIDKGFYVELSNRPGQWRSRET